VLCEVCGAEDAAPVAYTMLIGLGPYFLFRRGDMHRHCRRHVLQRGLLAYFVTLFTGWLGLSLAVFPFAIYRECPT